MLISCPHCSKQLKISEAAYSNIKKLPPGKSLKVQCIHCQQGFPFNVNMIPEKESATKHNSTVPPPGPPDISWLYDEGRTTKQMLEEFSRALLVVPSGEVKDTLLSEVEKQDFLVESPKDINEALEKIIHTPYQLVIYHSQYEKDGLAASSFHSHLSKMPIFERRNVFYVLVGPDMKTLYNLQALAFSANLVVNSADVIHIGNLLKKSMTEYRAFLQPLLEELRQIGE